MGHSAQESKYGNCYGWFKTGAELDSIRPPFICVSWEVANCFILGLRGWGVVILKHFPFAHPDSLFVSNHHRVLYGHVWRPLAASLKFTATNWLKLNAAGSYRSRLEWAGGRKGWKMRQDNKCQVMSSHAGKEQNGDSVNLLFNKALREEGYARAGGTREHGKASFNFSQLWNGFISPASCSVAEKMPSLSALSELLLIPFCILKRAAKPPTILCLFIPIQQAAAHPLRLSLMFLFCNCEVLNT